MSVQVAISKSGFVRTVQVSACSFEVQALSIRGERKPGPSPFWKKLYLVFDCDTAVELMHTYAGEPAGRRE
jgi:hypothetical protein